MLKLRTAQRSLLADKVVDAANIALGALTFGQFLSDRPLSATLALAGLALWASMVGCGIALVRKDEV